MDERSAAVPPTLSARQPRAIRSALTVLEAVAELGAGVTARELSVRLGMPRATTYRLLNILVEDEYLVRTPDLSGFALGAKVAQLAAVAAPAHIPTAARRLIDETRAALRGGVHLFSFEDGRPHVLDEDPDFPLRHHVQLGRDLTASAIGRLMLVSGGPPSDVRGQASAELTALGAVRRPDDGTGWGCLAAPILAESGRIVGGLVFAGPQHRVAAPEPVLSVLLPATARVAPYIV